MHLNQQGLNCPSKPRVCVANILSGITVNQGSKANGEWTSALRVACDEIEKMLATPETAIAVVSFGSYSTDYLNDERSNNLLALMAEKDAFIVANV